MLVSKGLLSQPPTSLPWDYPAPKTQQLEGYQAQQETSKTSLSNAPLWPMPMPHWLLSIFSIFPLHVSESTTLGHLGLPQASPETQWVDGPVKETCWRNGEQGEENDISDLGFSFQFLPWVLASTQSHE